MKDCTNSVNFSCLIAPVSSPKREEATKGVIPANTRANSNWAIRNERQIDQRIYLMILYQLSY